MPPVTSAAQKFSQSLNLRPYMAKIEPFTRFHANSRVIWNMGGYFLGVTCFMKFITAFVAATLLLAGVGFGADTVVYSQCGLTGDGESRRIGCDFRLSQPIDVKSAAISANGADLADLAYTSFESGDGKAAWFFLIDRSNPARAESVKRSVDLVKRLYEQANARNIMAIGTFAEDLRVVVSPGDPYADIESRMQPIKADGAATAFFFTAIKAIDILEKVEAQRRALVIISDGKAEDTAYSRDDVVRRAREAGVVIYGIGLAEKASDSVFLQAVERLASETGGPFVSTVGKEAVSSDFVANFRRFLTSGGSLSAPAAGLSGEVAFTPRLSLMDGAVVQAPATSLYLPPLAASPPPVEEVAAQQPLPLIARIYAFFDSTVPGTSVWAKENPNLAWTLLVMPVPTAAAVLLAAWRRTTSSASLPSRESVPRQELLPEDNPPVTQRLVMDDVHTTLRPVSKTFGYFEVLDGEPQRFDIREQNVTIGRHSESDFRLENDSVHRHHAIFHISPDKRPVITDLDTVNGVLVNGKRVAKSELQSGDVIAFGDVRVRFVGA
ncbi:FHA domain-containing protein [Rhizobium sp. CSW-27]|uniref:FHA domain-containing protein n=1 Tax=Rhizobium sp. CSW-27 TaxID=2839985 RepID=UPI001C022426|nr:FHA domain-containing protein [Rhizobium sp. CSW-27]MBT9373314.1 FHA domain-containing protein [Rhizobium sp. CSW-27]